MRHVPFLLSYHNNSVSWICQPCFAVHFFPNSHAFCDLYKSFSYCNISSTGFCTIHRLILPWFCVCTRQSIKHKIMGVRNVKSGISLQLVSYMVISVWFSWLVVWRSGTIALGSVLIEDNPQHLCKSVQHTNPLRRIILDKFGSWRKKNSVYMHGKNRSITMAFPWQSVYYNVGWYSLRRKMCVINSTLFRWRNDYQYKDFGRKCFWALIDTPPYYMYIRLEILIFFWCALLLNHAL